MLHIFSFPLRTLYVHNSFRVSTHTVAYTNNKFAGIFRPLSEWKGNDKEKMEMHEQNSDTSIQTETNRRANQLQPKKNSLKLSRILFDGANGQASGATMRTVDTHASWLQSNWIFIVAAVAVLWNRPDSDLDVHRIFRLDLFLSFHFSVPFHVWQLL